MRRHIPSSTLDYHPAEARAYHALTLKDYPTALTAAEEARDAYAASLNDERCGRMTRLASLLKKQP